MAGNQLGKTLAGSFEAAIHATGRYPEWWTGRRFDKPTVGWAAGVTGESTRDNVQRLLMGRIGQFGTGSIPAECVIGHSSARGVADLLDTIRVRHESGGESLIALKTYEKGREKWQGETLDWLWFDEEPDMAVYSEGLTRTQATGGLVWVTFTPLLGMSEVVVRYLLEPSAARHVTRMGILDAGHYSQERAQEIIEGYPPHERDARAYGEPILGDGAVFPVPAESLQYRDVAMAKIWPRICGLDFGWDHPTAAVWLAWDRDADTAYVYDAYRVAKKTPAEHTVALRARGAHIPVAWPHDGLQHDKGSGKPLANIYREAGANMLLEPAYMLDQEGGKQPNSLEAGISMMLERMKSGRLKVAAHLSDWWEEFRMYHRKDGLIVKERDDLMSATRYGLMMLRHATLEDGWGKKIDYGNSKWIV